ncbi:MFS transporter [Engelhardtia mirabilis]
MGRRDSSGGFEGNLARLAWFEGSRNALFWLPSFFLLFESRLPVDRVLVLASIYYAASVALEVPSGYLSDRVGRRITLVVGAAMQAVGCFAVAGADSFAVFAVGQACLAGANAFVSGTDTSLLFESLRAARREHELAAQEARIQRIGLVALGLAALSGGVLASIDLRLPHAMTGVASVVALVLALGLREPPRLVRRAAERELHLSTWGLMLGHLRQPALRWILAFAVASMVFNHVPFEFLQPYLAAVAAREGADVSMSAPLLAGLALGTTMLVAALASRFVLRLRARLGDAGTLLAAEALQCLVISTLAVAVHPVLAFVLVLRSVPQALSQPVVRAIVHPRVDGSVRATWLSFQSLVGRLVYSGALALAAGSTGGLAHLGAASLTGLLRGFAGTAVATLALMLLTRPRELRRAPLD